MQPQRSSVVNGLHTSAGQAADYTLVESLPGLLGQARFMSAFLNGVD